MQKLLVTVLVGFGFACGLLTGVLMNAQDAPKEPVCHTLAEDAFPYDCDYENGAWHRK